jgi:hypothetical protein
LSRREISITEPGSYERPHYQALQWMKARLLRDALGDPAGAADAFHHLYAVWRTSRLRDDALAEEVELRERLGQHDRACDVRETLAREFPCSRFGRHASEQLAACGRSPPEHADASCHHAPRRSGSPSDTDGSDSPPP